MEDTMRYMLIIHNDPEIHPQPGSPGWDELLASYATFNEQLASYGKPFSGDPLNDPSTATTIRVRNGETLTVDGPFAETKEWMSGYLHPRVRPPRPGVGGGGHGAVGQVRLGRGASRGGDVDLEPSGAPGPGGPVDDALEAVYRTDRGRVLARLIAVVKDFDLAEDAVQDAFVAAATAWKVTGIPDNPAGWLVTTARRKAVDRLRRAGVGRTAAAGLG